MDIRVAEIVVRRVRSQVIDLETCQQLAKSVGFGDGLGRFDEVLAQIRALEECLTDELDVAIMHMHDAR